MIFGTSGNVHDPPKPITPDFGSTKLLQLIQEQSLISFETYYVWKSRNRRNRFLENDEGRTWGLTILIRMHILKSQ